MANGVFLITDVAVKSFLEKPLSKAEGIALWWLVANLPAAGKVLSLAELGELLKVPRSRISLTIRKLCETGFLIRGSKVGLSYHYKLNPSFIRVLNT